MNNCIFLHFNIKKFIESRYKSLDKLVISLRSIQFSDPSTKNFQNSISIKPLWFYTIVTSFQSDHLLSFKPLWFNLSDLGFQPKFKFKSLRIFRAIFKSLIKPLIFSTGKLEYQHLSSLPDSQTELLVLPLKPGHHESKSTYQSGRWLSTRFSEPHLLTNIWTISNQIFDDHLNIRAPCYQQTIWRIISSALFTHRATVAIKYHVHCPIRQTHAPLDKHAPTKM